MKNSILFCAFVVLLAAGAVAQFPQNQAMMERLDLEKRRMQIALDDARRRRGLDLLNLRAERARTATLAVIQNLYRPPTKEERSSLAPSPDEAGKYSTFLKQKGTGMTRLIPDIGCDEMSLQDSISSLCSTKFTMPGGGSAYSFRVAEYRPWRLADLIFDGRHFLALGQVSQGFMFQAEGQSLENIGLDTTGIKFLADFNPAVLYDEVVKQNQGFVDGVKDGAFVYRKVLPASEGSIYVLRSIAYRGEAKRKVDGISYNELTYDKRSDVIVAFQVVKRAPDGSVTILWKLLREQDSPKIK